MTKLCVQVKWSGSHMLTLDYQATLDSFRERLDCYIADVGRSPSALTVVRGPYPPGSLVTRSGVRMTVSFTNEHGLVECQWFEGSHLHEQAFLPHELERLDE